MQQIIDILTGWYLFDLWVFTQWWLYLPLGIPLAFYLVFFMAKWAVVTLPLWLPFSLVAGELRRRKS